jgi:hypothetical protein
VLSPIAGTITKLSGRPPSAGAYMGQGGPFGWSIYVSGSGRTYYLTHFGSRNVRLGQHVTHGQAIGTIGDYPGATPDHIHEGLHGAAMSVQAGGSSGGPAAPMISIPRLRAPRIRGGGAVGRIVQRALRISASAANDFISRVSSSAVGPGTEPSVGDRNVSVGGSGAQALFQYMRKLGFTDNQAAGWVGNVYQETGGTFNAGIVQANGEGHGLAQWGGGRFTALQNFARSRGSSWTNFNTQLAFIQHELNGSERAANAAIRSAGSLAAATNAIATRYERAGIIGNRLGPARDALERFGPRFAQGGAVTGTGTGDTVPALLTPGEHVLTRSEVARLGGQSAVFAMRRELGGGGQGGPGYAAGGVVAQGIGAGASALDQLRRLANSNVLIAHGFTDLLHVVRDWQLQARQTSGQTLPRSTTNFLQRALPNRRLADLAEPLGGIVGELVGLRRTLKTGAGLTKRIRIAFADIFDDSGLFAQLQAAVQNIATRGATALQRRLVRVRRRGNNFDVSARDVSTASQERANFRTLEDTRIGLLDERGVLSQSMGAAQKALRSANKNRDKKAAQQAQAAIAKIKAAQDQVEQDLGDNAQALVESQQAIQSAVHDRITAQAERRANNLDRLQRTMAAVGRSLDPGEIARRQIGNYQAEIASPAAARARRAHRKP